MNPFTKSYYQQFLFNDLMAGVVVAVMLIPQGMAYAMLAGLPPQIGLYTSILPLILYSFFGSSNALAVGPVATVSLLVGTGLQPLAELGSDAYLQLVVTLTLMVGILHMVMSGLRLGFMVNLISRPVLISYTSAAAIVIVFSQVKNLFGVEFINDAYPAWQIYQTFLNVIHLKPITVGISVLSLAILWLFAFQISALMQRLGMKKTVADTLTKLGPLVAILVVSTITWKANLAGTHGEGVAIVGDIPAGLPKFTKLTIDLESLRNLLPLALVITLVGYLESISVAKVLANIRKEKIDPNRELLGLGMANLGSAISGGFPVNGGFSRSMVNHSAGVKTRAGSIVTALIVAISVIFMTPLFYYIPEAALAAIIVVAVVRLIDVRTPFKLWKSCREDAVAAWITFAGVLLLGIKTGILVGIITTFVLLLYRKSRPHIAVVGRVGESEHFRNYLRYPVEQAEGILIIRMDEGLSFINASFFESHVMEQVMGRPGIQSVLLVASGVNDIDSTGIDSLREINQALAIRGIGFYLSEVKGPVFDRLQSAGVEEVFLKDHIFLSTHEAVIHLTRIKPE